MFAKVAFLSCVAFVSAQYAAPIAAPVAAPGSGYSQQSRSQDDAGNYAFSYDIVNEYGAANGRQESGDSYGNKQGSYVIQDIDGRSRRVDYVADELGFRATINTNEPGTAPSEPASALYNSPAGVVAAAPSFAAPARVLAPAPVAVAAPARLIAPAPVAVAAPQFVQRFVQAPVPVAAPQFAAPVAVAAPQFAAPQFAQPIFQRQVIARAPIAVAPAAPVFAQRFVQQAPFVTQTGPIPVGPSRLVQAAPARIQVSQRLTAQPVFAQAPVFAARAAPVFAQAAPVAVASPFAFNTNIVHAAPVIRKA